MTLVRRVAVAIPKMVMRHATPAALEWAAGIAREVEFVEGDWRALGWALGSVRILFDYQRPPFRSLAELHVVAEEFAQAKRKGNATWKWMWIYAAVYLDKVFHARSGMERSGDLLILLGWTLMSSDLYIEWWRRFMIPPCEDVEGLIRFYKVEMERVRDIPRSLMGWVGGLAITLICLGMPMEGLGGLSRSWAVFTAVMWVGSVLGFLLRRRKNRRLLEQLNGVLAELR